MFRRLVLIFAVSIGIALPARAQDSRQGLDLSSLSDFELGQRLDFITQRLERDRRAGWMYQWGWTAFYAASMTQSIVDASLTHDRKTKNTDIVEGAESFGSLVWSFASPHPARLGAQPIFGMPDTNHEERVERLRAAEDLLQEDADAANERYDTFPHLFNIATNVAAGALIWSVADRTRALRSAIPGLFIGEFEIFSAPIRASGDLRDYNARFNGVGRGQAQADWELVPTFGGAEIRFRF